jgi:hypothetical protein
VASARAGDLLKRIRKFAMSPTLAVGVPSPPTADYRREKQNYIYENDGEYDTFPDD